MATSRRCLDFDQLNNVYSIVKASGFSSTQWIYLGLELGLEPTTLEEIEAVYRTDPSRCLLECLEKWLHRCDKVDIYGGPTWVALIVALEKLNENTAAGKIEEQMQPSPASKILQRYLSTLYQCIITDPSIAEVLSTEIPNVQCISESVLLVGIQNAVHDNHKNLQALGGVLQKISSTAKLGSEILNEYYKVSPEGTPTIARITPTIAGSTSTETSAETIIHIPHDTKRYFTEVRVSFGITFIRVHETLSRHNYPLESLKDCFLSSYRHLKPQVSECNTIKDFFLKVVQNECNLIDITVLRSLVEFTEIDEAKQHVKNYQLHVDYFCEEMNVRLGLRELFLPKGCSPPLKLRTIKFAFDWDKDEDDQHTLNDDKLLLSDALGRLFSYVKPQGGGLNITEERLLRQHIAEEGELNITEERLLRQHIAEEGELNITVAKAILYGPPGVGKTTLMKRLIGELENLEPNVSYSQSTGIDAPITVPVYRDIECREMIVDQWKHHTMAKILQICISCLKSKASSISTPISPSVSSKHLVASSFLPTSAANQHRKSPDKHKDGLQAQYEESDSSSVHVDQHESTRNHESLQEDLPSLVKDCIKSASFLELREQLKDIENVTLLQLVDIGGQPEFHEIYPLLLSGPALYLLFFDLSRDINELFTFTYRHENGSVSQEYKSQLTTLQVLHQILSCIDSSGEKKTAAMLIGTYLDEFKNLEKADDKAVRKLVQEKVGQRLKKSMENTSYYQNNVFITNGADLLFAVDNVSGTYKPEIELLQATIKRALKRMHRKVTEPLPTSWAIFYFLLRDFPNKNNGKMYCTLEEAKAIAAEVKIKDAEVALNYIHRQFGSVLYYHDISDDKGIKYVFCDTNAILKPVTHLVAVCLGSNPDYAIIADRLRKTGLIKIDDFDKLCKSFQSSIPLGYIVKLLQKQMVISNEIDSQYFIPSLVYVRENDTVISSSVHVAPLLLTFSRKSHSTIGYFPPGLFSALLVKLVATPKWSLRDVTDGEIAFWFGEQKQRKTVVTLVAKSQCLEVGILNNSVEPCVCSEIREDIKKSFGQIKDIILQQYLNGVSMKEAFHCKSCNAVAVVVENFEELDCTCSKTLIPMNQKHRIWFSGISTLNESTAQCQQTVAGSTSVQSSTATGITSTQDEKRIIDEQQVKKVFRSHFAQLAELMANSYDRLIGVRLFSAGLITKACYDDVSDKSPKSDQEKGIILANGLLFTINDQPQLVIKLIETLREVDEFKKLSQKLSDKLNLIQFL